jgi:hypothetical protein
MIWRYGFTMPRQFAVLILAFALAALPFGMGSMMAVQAGADHAAAHHSDHHGAAQAHHALHPDHHPGAASQATETLGLLHLGHGDAPGSGQTDTDGPDAGAHLHFAACGSCLSLPAMLGDILPLPSGGQTQDMLALAPLDSLETLPALPPPRA